MAVPAQVGPAQTTSSFSKLLASLSNKLNYDPWDDSELANDVATLTYEQALLATRRIRDPRPAGNLVLDRRPGSPFAPEHQLNETHGAGAKKQRNASITIRVTAEEQAQLHERAEAAQLSVSAYLRSCIFEAESLRSQVREALAQIKLTQTEASQTTTIPSRNWRERFFPGWPRSRVPESSLSKPVRL